jgi:hypothetical protein
VVNCKHGMPTDWCAICTPRPKAKRLKILKDQALVIKKRQPKFCSVDGCGRKHEARGFCRKHYDKFRPDNADRALLYYWKTAEKRREYARQWYWKHVEKCRKESRERMRRKKNE